MSWRLDEDRLQSRIENHNIAMEKLDGGGNEYEFKSHGLQCLMLRHPEFGHWCGYVEVPKDHKWYNTGYDDINVDVHGGLTFTGDRERFPDLFFIGFDCAHAGDYCPGLHDREEPFERIGFGETYKNKEYVIKEIKNLARQVSCSYTHG